MTMQEKLGIKKIGNTNTAEGCERRAADIRRLVERKDIGHTVLGKKLLAQANWYQSKANRLGKSKRSRKVNGKRKAA